MGAIHSTMQNSDRSDRQNMAKVVHLKGWTSFFETFPVGPNGSIELWTEISGNLVEWIAPLQVLVKRMTLRRFVIIKAK